MLGRRGLTASWLAYLVFVVYGSLVPLDFRPMPFDEAVRRFYDAPWLNIGVEGRADWIANAVLYLPLGFMSARLGAGVAGRPSVLTGIVALAWCSALAVGVEFTQEFFPPRTVSRNDILAEVIGSVLGIVLVPMLRPWVERVRNGWLIGGSARSLRLLEIYAVGYVAVAFFPYDLLLSSAELQDKIRSDHWAWLLGSHPRGWAFALLSLVVEVLTAMPIGALLVWRRPSATRDWVRPALVGLWLGLLIEGGQFFLESGVSQGASVLARMLGVVAGAALWPDVMALGHEGLRRILRHYSIVLLPGYVLVLAFASGLFRVPWQGVAAAKAAWSGIHLTPFYYHYYTTEAHALYSLVSVTMMYLPVAAICWAWRLRVWAAAAIAGSLALVIEGCKLFIAEAHPDPTNVLIAAATCAIALNLSNAAARTVATPPKVRQQTGNSLQRWFAGFVVVAAAAWGWVFPAFSFLLVALLVICAAVVGWRPVLALAILPAAMPILDLAPWSGRFFMDEFDLLSATCLAVAFARSSPAGPGERRSSVLTLAFVALAASLAISTLRALWPLQALDGNSFTSYTSPYNALRIVKGALWAWLFVGLYRRLKPRGDERSAMFGTGMAIGLMLTVACIVWERVTFVGLLDFTSVYRVSGPFSAMHKGGAYVECYLVAASAFVVLLVMRLRRRILSAFAALLLAGAGYAVAVTYSRNGYAAMAVMLAVALTVGVRWRRPRRGDIAMGTAALIFMVGAAAPVIGGSFARERLSQSGPDLVVRRDHWVDALALRSEGLATFLFGEGLGRFPDLHFWRSREPIRAASYHLRSDGDKDMLRLGSGATLYIEQVVDPGPGAQLVLSADLRAPSMPAALAVALCEKWLLTSTRCSSAKAIAPGAAGSWHHAEVPLLAPTASHPVWPFRPLVKFALLTPPGSATVDVTNLKLQTPAGENLLANGSFATGLDHWFFSTDVDPPWHIHSLPLAVLFDQGWFGVAAWLSVLLAALGSGIRLSRDGRAQSPAALAAVAGFLVCGTLNTLIDEPRFLWLLLVLLWLGAADRGQPIPEMGKRSPRLEVQRRARLVYSPQMPLGQAISDRHLPAGPGLAARDSS